MTLLFLWLGCLAGVLVTTALSWFYTGHLGRSAAPATLSVIILLQVALWTSLGDFLFVTFPGWGPARHRALLYAWALVIAGTVLCVLLVFAQKTTSRFAAWYKRHDQLAPFLAIFSVLIVAFAPIAAATNQPVANKSAVDTAAIGVAKSVVYLSSPGEIPTAHQVIAGVTRFNSNSQYEWTASVKPASRTAEVARYTVTVSDDSSKRCLAFSIAQTNLAAPEWSSTTGACKRQ